MPRLTPCFLANRCRGHLASNHPPTSSCSIGCSGSCRCWGRCRRLAILDQRSLYTNPDPTGAVTTAPAPARPSPPPSIKGLPTATSSHNSPGIPSRRCTFCHPDRLLRLLYRYFFLLSSFTPPNFDAPVCFIGKCIQCGGSPFSEAVSCLLVGQFIVISPSTITRIPFKPLLARFTPFAQPAEHSATS